MQSCTPTCSESLSQRTKAPPAFRVGLAQHKLQASQAHWCRKWRRHQTASALNSDSPQCCTCTTPGFWTKAGCQHNGQLDERLALPVQGRPGEGSAKSVVPEFLPRCRTGIAQPARPAPRQRLVPRCGESVPRQGNLDWLANERDLFLAAKLPTVHR